jgi:NADH-quinone oxidoreductase subunit L
MLLPLCLLAVGSIVTGYHWLIDMPGFLRPVFRLPEEARPHHVGWLMPAALGVAFAGIAFAAFLYTLYSDVPPKLAERFRGAYRVLQARYGFDLLYDWFASRVVVGGSETLLWKKVDAAAIDGLVNGTGELMAAASRRVRLLQSGLVRGYALLILAGTVAVLGYLMWPR